MSLGLCVVGCGAFARTFVKGVRAFGDLSSQVDLYFASRDESRSRAYRRRYAGVDSFGSYEEAAADPRVQAMYFSTPHHLHMEHALLAARYGKHILVEKPISRTLEEGQHMISAARDAGVVLMVAENYRYMPVFSSAKELVDQGVLGNLRFIQVQEESRYGFDGWRTDREMMGGGVLIDGGVHSVHMLVELGGLPEEVYASILPRAADGLGGEDGIVLMARLPGGSAGLINHAWGVSKRDWDLWVNLSGTLGRIYFKPRTGRMTLETVEGKRVFRFPEDREGIGHMVSEFLACIRDGRPPLTSGEVGLRDLEVVLSAYESAETGGARQLG